jgi:fructokinase
MEAAMADGPAIGIDLGGTKIEGIVLSPDGAELKRTRIATGRDRGYEHILDRVAKVVDVLRPHAPRATTIGVGTPGSLSRRGLLKNSNTTCLNGRPLGDDLARRVGCAVVLENDANCFALAEATSGAGRGHRCVFGVILGTGVGGGIVMDGRVWSGPQHVAGEWGHHTIDPAGPPCYCGKRGCVETFLSGPSISAAYAAAGGRIADAEAVVQRADQGDAIAARVVEEWLACFGRALGNVINVLDPDAIVLGGGLSNVFALYDRGRNAVARHVFNDECTTPILRNALGDSAGVVGAAWLVRAAA